VTDLTLAAPKPSVATLLLVFELCIGGLCY